MELHFGQQVSTVVAHKSQRGSGASLHGTIEGTRPSRDAASELLTGKLRGSEIEKSKFQLWPVLSQTQTDGKNTTDKNSKYNFVVQFNLVILLVYTAFPLPTFF